jgi:hypothetical protein
MQPRNFFDQLIQHLAFPFKDKEWAKKIGIGFAITLSIYIVPILPALLIAGYGRRIMKRIILENGDPYLPEWNGWGNMLSEGLPLWGASMIYVLPLLILFVFDMVFAVGAFFVQFLLMHSDGTIAPGGLLVMVIVLIVMVLLMLLIMVVSLVTNFFQTAATGHLVKKNSFAAAFHAAEWWPVLKKGFGAFSAAILLLMGMYSLALMAIQILNMSILFALLYPLALILLVYLVSIYSYVFSALAYREGLRRLG